MALLLHCNMDSELTLQLSLDDLLADLRHARRGGDLSRLALIAYCEVRRWARQAHQDALAQRSAAIVIGSPHASRDAFLADIDALIAQLDQIRSQVV
ncbi:MAG: hypothetical protein FGM55_01910 [Rhodoferax sp.]|nr:hypothetical protein [Rhodoferax sp.]